MPTYSYQCSGCGDTFDKSLKISDRKEPEQLPCDKCQGKITQVLLAAPRIVSGVSVRDKRPEGWKDVLRKVDGTAGRKSTIDV